MGCGFLEKVYENALAIELARLGLQVDRQVALKVVYKQQVVREYLADLVVEGVVLVELKATVEHSKIFEAQIINYLHATGLPVGLLLNFGQPRVKVQRFVRMSRKLDDISDRKIDEWRQVN